MRLDYIFPEQGTQGIFGRIAVWNMAKIPFVIAMGVWVADVAVLITGKYILQSTKEYLLTMVIPQVQCG
jgi:hypothetical protein